MKLRLRQLLTSIALPLILAVMSFGGLQRVGAVTVSGSDWRPGRIIDDSIFFNKNAMTVGQIQAFLDAKVPVCAKNHSDYSPTYPGPYTCLKDYQENTTTGESNIGRYNNDGTPYQVPGGKSASQIIWEAAQAHGINPQTLIVMLQKEQSLVTDDWPLILQYQRAMGQSCPDTAPCDPDYAGFYNQVNGAAWQLRHYINHPEWFNYRSGVTRFILYNPNTSCGGSNVFIENDATAALYNYTPYQPNAGSLSNLYGTASCGAYGNRNFWRLFNNWFGSTEGTPFFRIDNQPSVFILGYGNRYYHINTNSLLTAYGYPNRITKIANFDNSYISNKIFSGILPRYARFESDQVYAVDAGVRRWFSSRSLLEDTYGLTLGDEAQLLESTKYYLPEYSPMQPVALQSGSSKIYSIENGAKRYISSWLAYINTGSPAYSTRGIIPLSSEFLALQDDGSIVLNYLDLFRINGTDAVYMVTSDTSSVWVPSKSYLVEFGINIKDARNVTSSEVSTYNQSGALGLFVKKPSGQIWLISEGGYRRYVSDEMADEELYNLDYSVIPQLTDSSIFRYKSSPPLTELIHARDNHKIFLVENGTKRWAQSWTTLNAMGYDQFDLTPVSQILLDSMPDGANIP